MRRFILFCVIILLLLSMAGFLFADGGDGEIVPTARKIDLNRASLSQLMTLPITEAQARAIYDYRTYIAFFESIYDLREIPQIDQQTMVRLRPLVTISLYSDLDETERRREEIYYLLERLGSQEGIQEGFTDIWEDYLMTPRNINTMHYTDILNMPNVSPIDAAAIARRIKAEDKITDYRNLRSTTGLSFYGASNLRHYIYYDDAPDSKKLFASYQFKYELLPFDDDTQAMYKEVVKQYDDSILDLRQSYWGAFGLNSANPAFTNKIRIRYQPPYTPYKGGHSEVKAGIIFFNQTGEKLVSDKSNSANLDDAKFYAAYEGGFNLWGRNDFKVYAGNYRVTYGEGLVIESTDYYSSRKTGYGFSKRIIGITEDLSRSQEYALRGFAMELKRPYFSTAFWYSNDKKDAVVYDTNRDGRIDSDDKVDGKYHLLSYITPTIRFDNDELNEVEAAFNEKLFRPMYLGVRTDILEEKMLGGRVEVSPFVGTHLGLTATQTLYDNAHFVVPQDIDDLKDLLIRDQSQQRAWGRIDSQIFNLYSTYVPDKYERDYRNVFGLDWRTVFGNTSIQGEYAELTVHGSDGKIGDDPSAVVVSSYTQFDNLYFIALYRNYDLGFDNPYNRGFSEHRKYNNTVLNSDMYILDNQLLGDMYLNSAEPQAEQGFYFETRYRFSNYLTLNRTYIDIFERKADGRRTVRFQGDIDYRPIYQLSLRGKYKHQINRYDDQADRGVSETVEPSAIVTTYLSNRDRLQVEYRYTQVKSPPYPYLTNSGSPGNVETHAVGQTLMHGDFIRLDWTHNLNDKLRFRNSIAYWNGHSLSHWDFEDVEIDFLGEHGIKHWILVQNKIANNVYLSLKFKTKWYRTKELFFRTWWNTNEELEGRDYFDNVERTEHAVRLQIDWRF